MFSNKLFAEADNILCFCAVKPNCLDVLNQLLFPELDHFFRGIDNFKQSFGRFVNTDIRGLSRQNHSNQQRIVIAIVELAYRFWIGFFKPSVKCFNISALHHHISPIAQETASFIPRTDKFIERG